MDGEVTRRQCRISSRIGELLPIMYVENPSLCERSITIARGCGHRTAMSTVAHPTVVVVNDDPVQLHVTSSLIERDGMRVIPCSGAEEALRILTQNGHVDVIVLPPSTRPTGATSPWGIASPVRPPTPEAGDGLEWRGRQRA